MVRKLLFKGSSISTAKTLAGLVAASGLSLALSGLAPALAEVAVTGDEQRVIGLPADYGSLGDENSSAAIACWQQGQKIFSDKDYNTVLLGALTSESAITLKNNANGAQTLAISLDHGLCLVTINP